MQQAVELGVDFQHYLQTIISHLIQCLFQIWPIEAQSTFFEQICSFSCVSGSNLPLFPLNVGLRKHTDQSSVSVDVKTEASLC